MSQQAESSLIYGVFIEDAFSPAPVPLHRWASSRRERASSFRHEIIRCDESLLKTEGLSEADVLLRLDAALDWTRIQRIEIPSCTRLADVVFELVGVREPATVAWVATVESLELDAALVALNAELVIRPPERYRGTGERTQFKGHVSVSYVLTTPRWLDRDDRGTITAPNEDAARRVILRKVRARLADSSRSRLADIEDLGLRIEKLRTEASAIQTALQNIDRTTNEVRSP